MNFITPSHFLSDKPVIALVGAGGTGSQLADQLASLEATLRKLGHQGFDVTVYDGDRVSDSNVGRQRFYSGDVGLNKAVILCHRLNTFYGLNWRAEPDYFDVSVPRRCPDLLITATDKAAFRAEIAKHYGNIQRSNPAFWLDTGNGSSSGNVVLGHLTTVKSGLRLPNVFDLYPELSKLSHLDDEAPSCSTEQALTRQDWPVNRLSALCATDILWSFLRHGSLSHHGAFFKTNPMSVSPIPICPQTWEFMGYIGPNNDQSSI